MSATSAPEVSSRVLGGKEEEKFLNAFFVLYKTARILEQNNSVFKKQSEHLFEQIELLAREHGDVSLKVLTGRFFVNDLMVRFDDKGQSGAATVINEWRMLGVGGLIFTNGIDLEGLRKFVSFVASQKPQGDNVESVATHVAHHGVAHVRLLSLKEVGASAATATEEVRKHFRQVARSSFFQAMTVVEELVVSATQEKELNLAKTKRVVHALIDHIFKDESSLIELAAIKDFDDYTYAHSTNVCIYALTLGVRLGMDRSRLSQLGFTALFHDIGKVRLPKDLIRKPDAFDENDWIQMQRHPMLGAKTIFHNMKLDPYTARAARGAFEHHINNDFTGYPQLHYRKSQPNLFSKIIAVVDTFDALTSGRIYLKKSIPPDEVMRKMRYQMTVKFDPFLLKLFNDVIGIYPAGSLVLLTSDEIALVLTNNDRNMAKPYVKVVGNKEGLLEEPLWVDLASEENLNRRIIRMVDPARYGLDLRDFVLND
jgi:HD-GYP domain-containing protein (c-di-GMP phosphodiesterase class II)